MSCLASGSAAPSANLSPRETTVFPRSGPTRNITFVDVTDQGPVGTVASFNEKDIATLSRTSAHTVSFSITFKTGSSPDQVKITIDGKLAATGTSWKNYYKFDPEQTGTGNVVPSTSKLGFFLRGTAVPSDLHNGYLFDNVTLSSS